MSATSMVLIANRVATAQVRLQNVTPTVPAAKTWLRLIKHRHGQLFFSLLVFCFHSTLLSLQGVFKIKKSFIILNRSSFPYVRVAEMCSHTESGQMRKKNCTLRWTARVLPRIGTFLSSFFEAYLSAG